MGGVIISFKEIEFQNHYDTIKDNVVDDFYIPVMKNAKKYQRAVAYFESKILAIIANGLKDFILNNGKMELVCGPKLSYSEIESIQNGLIEPEEIIESKFLNDLENLEDEIIKNHVKILGWLIANGFLKIKIAIKKDKTGNLSNDAGILHYKIGVLQDHDGNILSFSGSINDTAMAWSRNNMEDFHVFRSWETGDISHLKSDIDTFNNVWYGLDDCFDVISVPDAVEQELIRWAPDNWNDLSWGDEVMPINDEKPVELYDYQKEARDNWIAQDSQGVFEMATGTGKTYTALGCLEYLTENEDKLVTVISAPYQHLLPQWRRSIVKFPIYVDKIIIADSTNNKWDDEVASALAKTYLGNTIKHIIILTTHDTFSGDKFINLMKEFKKAPYFLIGDEMHGLGSAGHRIGLDESLYEFRLGLSATPIRYSDIETQFLRNFFKENAFEFSLDDAINTYDDKGNRFLTPFYYKPYFLSLNKEELKKYREITKKLVKLDKDDERFSGLYEKYLFDRADIIKDANNKYIKLNEILSDLNEISGLIIYCSENQIDKVCDMLNDKKIMYSRFTMELDSKPSKKYGGLSCREIVLEEFARGSISVLVAMHCLDEGVDVPSAKQAIFMCSSNSSREFIQRIGRVIRTYEDKERAYIYDLIVKPQLEEDDPLKYYEDKIFEREKIRYDEIGSVALNVYEVHTDINSNFK